ncbi:PfkB family carbohydrate kinase [Oligoflexia bacterium]|nr:PfkB family carbohydrate kinase [Oligoflexia bacterium]
MENKKKIVDVLCVGDACYDQVFGVDHHPAPDEKCSASSFLSCGGGPAANAAVTVARLGYLSAFAGYLGEDVFGDLHFKELEKEGVVLDYIVRGAAPTRLSSIFIKPDGARSVVNFRTATGEQPADSIGFSSCEPRAILFDGHEPHLSVALAKRAAHDNIPTILDAGSVHCGTELLVDAVDYIVASEMFSSDFSGEANPERAVVALSDRCQAAVVTLGERGSVWARSLGVSGSVKPFCVDVVDSTGAGDAFHGAFAVGIAMGMEWDELLRYASAAGAVCCTKPGGRPGLPYKGEIEALCAPK